MASVQNSSIVFMVWETSRIAVPESRSSYIFCSAASLYTWSRREGFVHYQDVRLHVDRDGEAQSRAHPAREGLERLVHVLRNVCEFGYVVEAPQYLLALHAQNHTVQHDVLAAR